MDIATASLLDEGTAAAEAMAMFHRLQPKKVGAGHESVFLVGKGCYPQTLDVLRGRAEPLDIRLEIVDVAQLSDEALARAFGLLLQYPDDRGGIVDLSPAIDAGAGEGRPGRRGHGSHGADAHHAAGRDGSRCRGRELAAVRRAARLRRSARGVSGDARIVRAPGAGANHRAVDRCPWPPGLPHGAPDARAAHPPRESDVEHLHRAGAPGQHRRDVRGLSRPRWPPRDRLADP